MCMYIYIYIYVHLYRCIYIYIYIHVHTHIQAHRGAQPPCPGRHYRAFLRGGLVDMGFRIFMAGYLFSMSGREVLRQGVCNVCG